MHASNTQFKCCIVATTCSLAASISMGWQGGEATRETPEQQPRQTPATEQPAQTLPRDEQPQAQPSISEAQIDQAVEAYLAVTEIQKRLQDALAEVEDPQSRQDRIDAARPTMEAAVDDAGLTLREYEQIITAVNQNDVLRETFLEKLDAKRSPRRQQEAGSEGVERSAVSAEDLQGAAQAYAQITRLNQQLQQDLAGVEDGAKIQERVRDAESEMEKQVVAVGLTVEQYSRIMQAVQQDEDLFEQFRQHLE